MRHHWCIASHQALLKTYQRKINMYAWLIVSDRDKTKSGNNIVIYLYYLAQMHAEMYTYLIYSCSVTCINICLICIQSWICITYIIYIIKYYKIACFYNFQLRINGILAVIDFLFRHLGPWGFDLHCVASFILNHHSLLLLGGFVSFLLLIFFAPNQYEFTLLIFFHTRIMGHESEVLKPKKWELASSSNLWNSLL